VRAILRDEAKASTLSAIGCDVALADLQDPSSLGRAIADARAVQVIMPPPPQAQDAPGEMRRSIASIAEALEMANPEVVLVISDYGAHVGKGVGMPSMFHEFEERLRQLKMSKVILRSAEHMEGWGALIPVAIATGTLPSLHHPVEKTFPTVSAPDVGLIAAKLLLGMSPGSGEQVIHAEGPRRYSATDVSLALSQLLGHKITAVSLPRAQWQESLERFLSTSAARLLVELYDAHNKGGLIDVAPNTREVRYGTTELIEALRPLVAAAENSVTQ
jgi:uncharacterized protein YbjT (DUF2867 family)